MNLAGIYQDLASRAASLAGVTSSIPLKLASDFVLHKLIDLTGSPPRLGLFLHDELLGWKLRPSASVRHAIFEFNARYTTSAEGRRVVPLGSSGPALYFLGCSVTFGFWNDDDVPFAALLARDYRVENWAVPGYGPAHCYFQLMRQGLLERAARTGGTIIYCWFPFHAQRVWRRKSWLERLERVVSPMGAYQGNPLFEIEDERLIYRGLVRVADAVPDSEPIVSLMEWRITDDLLVAMNAAALKAGVPFVVAVMESDTDRDNHAGAAERMCHRLKHLAIDSIDLRGDALIATHLLSDYPTDVGHRALAHRLATALERRAK